MIMSAVINGTMTLRMVNMLLVFAKIEAPQKLAKQNKNISTNARPVPAAVS